MTKKRLVNTALAIGGMVAIGLLVGECVKSPAISATPAKKTTPQVQAHPQTLALVQQHPDAEIPIEGRLRVEVLDAKNICLVGYYHDFLRERFTQEGGEYLRGLDQKQPPIPAWMRRMSYNIFGAQIILKYRPFIARAYQDVAGFSLKNGPAIRRGGYWINPIGQARFPDATTQQDNRTNNAEVAHYAFLELDAALEPGQTYTLQTPLGQAVAFSYQPATAISPVIKYNQVGYSAKAPRKYAYIGAWLGTLGPLDLGAFTGKPFFLRDADTKAIAFSGNITPRGPDVFFEGDTPFTGEDVYQLEFSDFQEIGRFFIEVPGLGRTEDFAVGPDALGEAFYIHARGLYHKRCGIAKEPPYTAWETGACHLHTYRGGFPPNINHYKAKNNPPDSGFFNEKGEAVDIVPFTLVEATKTDEIIEGVNGGWHDAADYDRRPFHYDVVTDLLSAYLARPQNFLDGQLNLPESGNGIPDILDEVIWGMDVWRKAQAPDGGVGGWIEANSHPHNDNPATDDQRYYLSATTMESSMQYAAHASMLALALKIAGHEALATRWQNSAQSAYRYASDPAHRAIFHFQYPFQRMVDGKRKTFVEPIVYKEEPTVPSQYVFKAAFNLFLLTSDSAYLKQCEAVATKMPQRFAETSWRINPLFFTEWALYHKKAPSLEKTFNAYKTRTLQYADERLHWLDTAYPYRIAWYPPDHRYVTHMAWGKFHPFNNAKFFLLANILTESPWYRAAAFLCNDWSNGANPFGTTMTSGLGKRYPVRFLDLPSFGDGIDEYVPGITPYRNTFGIDFNDVAMAHALIYPHRPERGFTPEPVMLLPPKVTGAPPYALKQLSMRIGKVWPVWRRFANVEGFTVAASEYTVSETIAPAAAITGWLMTPGWLPPQSLKDKKPAEDIRDLGGFTPLP